MKGWLAALAALLALLAAPGCTSVHDQRLAACRGDEACIAKEKAEFAQWLENYRAASVGYNTVILPQVLGQPRPAPTTTQCYNSGAGTVTCRTN